jgi:hypothetical protein
MRVPAAASTTDRQSVEKGRDGAPSVSEGGASGREALYKGRDEGGSADERKTDRADVTTTSPDRTRPTRTYDSGDAQESRVPSGMSRSRRKVSELRRWA